MKKLITEGAEDHRNMPLWSSAYKAMNCPNAEIRAKAFLGLVPKVGNANHLGKQKN